MATLHFSSPSLLSTHNPLSELRLRTLPKSKTILATKSAIEDTNNGAQEQTPKPPRRGRRKRTSDAINSPAEAPDPPKPSRRGRKKKTPEPAEIDLESGEIEEMDFTYMDPPLVCCFGSVRKEFVPTVRVSDRRMHPDMYSTWKGLQWDPPEFVRAPGGSPSNVAISHARLGGRAAFMGKVGDDEFGEELVLMMNQERVQTRAVKFDSNAKTGFAHMKFRFEDGRMKAETARESAEDSLMASELNIDVLKEARIFHFNSEVLTSPALESTLYKAIALSKKYGGLVFFDLNLPLPLWKSRDETREMIKKAWQLADIIEVSREELEFLLDEDYYEHKRSYKAQYYAESYDETKNRRSYYHYTPEEISPLWHDGIKFLFVTDGTLRIHYYSPSFHGAVVGTEDVLITPYTCDRTGSGDAVVAAIMRKLTTHPEMYENQDVLERQLRFAVAAGIISQWTIGAVRGFPTESATQNLKEQVYVPSMW
ncbi:hypothetical protein Syun_000390 [Stephania yunnanensis]|uniref:Carbohydrate kinase PfkB domain-containing protein n=1 Tax=Stephania yunnanensis TaxID=152371 RepID=A0AAP0Q5I7_9MAGN